MPQIAANLTKQVVMHFQNEKAHNPRPHLFQEHINLFIPVISN